MTGLRIRDRSGVLRPCATFTQLGKYRAAPKGRHNLAQRGSAGSPHPEITWSPGGAAQRSYVSGERGVARLLLLIAVSLFATGCTVGPKYHAPNPQTPEASNYKESTVNFPDAQGWKVASPQDAMLRGKWWEVFNDPDLNALEDRLEINNENIKQYFQQFMEARALIAQARAQYWPTVTVNPSISFSHTPFGTAVNSAGALDRI
jgi:hypothetical protein